MKPKPYPRSLYRRDERAHREHVFGGVPCAILTVESEEEEKAAKAVGWRNSPEEAGKLDEPPKKSAAKGKKNG